MNTSTSTLTRRDFIRVTAQASAAAAVAFPFVARGRVIGANDRIGVGFIGVGGRGRSHVATVQNLIKSGENIQITAVNDAYRFRLDEAAKLAGAKAFMRHQELLADPAVDVVCIATPDRLHVPQALDAIRAGKDVYCEKPMGHWSQFAISKKFYTETKDLNRIVQIGNQANSSPAWGPLRQLIQQGAVGRPQHVSVGYYRRGDWGERMHIPDPEAKPGPDLDWDGVLGDAPKVPFTVNRFFSWRKYLDYAGGPCTDLFPHVLTPFISALGLGCPSLAVASGGIFKFTTYDREVPDTFNLCLDYPEKLSINLVCTLSNEFNSDPVIRGDEGTIVLKNARWEGGVDELEVYPVKGEKRVVKGGFIDATPAHWKNLLECVRTRAKPVSDVEFGFKVQTALCMGMLGYLQKKVPQFDALKREIVI